MRDMDGMELGLAKMERALELKCLSYSKMLKMLVSRISKGGLARLLLHHQGV